MSKINNPCTCTHSRINHGKTQFYLKNNYMIDTREACGVKDCECEDFKLDNLKYLEKEDEAREQ
jgi:hypothetical protein